MIGGRGAASWQPQSSTSRCPEGKVRPLQLRVLALAGAGGAGREGGAPWLVSSGFLLDRKHSPVPGERQSWGEEGNAGWPGPGDAGQSSLLLAGGELADLAAGGAGLAGGVGGGAGPALALGPGAQLPRLRPVHAHGLGQPLAAALPVLPGLLLRHLSWYCEVLSVEKKKRI